MGNRSVMLCDFILYHLFIFKTFYERFSAAKNKKLNFVFVSMIWNFVFTAHRFLYLNDCKMEWRENIGRWSQSEIVILTEIADHAP